jgi:ABC-type cobalt transport system substrate-binding protein
MNSSTQSVILTLKGRQQGKSQFLLMAGIAISAFVLHWVLSGIGQSWVAMLVHSIITLLALFMAWLMLSGAAKNESGKYVQHEAQKQSAVESVLMQTHPQFATNFEGASGDLDRKIAGKF